VALDIFRQAIHAAQQEDRTCGDQERKQRGLKDAAIFLHIENRFLALIKTEGPEAREHRAGNHHKQLAIIIQIDGLVRQDEM